MKKGGKYSRIYFWLLSDCPCSVACWKDLEQSTLLLQFLFIVEQDWQREDDFQQDAMQQVYVYYLNLHISTSRGTTKQKDAERFNELFLSTWSS